MQRAIKKIHSLKNNKKIQKPVFLSKKKREELNQKIEKKIEKARINKRKIVERQRRCFDKLAKGSKRRYVSRKDHDSFYNEEKEKKPKSKNEREKETKEKIKIENKIKLTKDIKDTYLGRKKRPKRIIPMDHRQRFCFDWEPTEDTSADLNELYNRKADVTLAFGRGFIAGVDRRTQKEKNIAYKKILKKQKLNDFKSMEKIAIRNREKIKKLEIRRKERSSRSQWTKKKLKEMTQRDWRILKEDFNINTRGKGQFKPIRFWKESGLNAQILETLKKLNYKDPTPIQRISIPIGLKNRDIVGVAETGSGKTCAFIIPMISYILKLAPMTPIKAVDGPYSVVLAPSRELAEQIETEVKRFADPMGIRVISIIGGKSVESQGMDLRAGAEILIATPGRLKDCLDRKFVVFNQCNYIVLDEADRMMDMGFEPQVVEIFDRMPSSNLQPDNLEEIDSKKMYRQTIMFSATMPLSVEKLSMKYLRNPIYVSIGERFGEAASTIKQNIIFLTENEKRKKLQELIERLKPPIMVFCNQKKKCDEISKYIFSQGFNCIALHGGKSQESRGSALNSFKEGNIDILVCTDVAGRGIDVKGVTHVINFDMPKNIEYYTHRIGRTGRAGAEGEATTFLTSGDEEMFFSLKKLLIDSNNVVPNELASHPAAQRAPGSILQGMPKVVYCI